nr:MAG: hypothetical protein [Hypoviridae sp.]
MSLSLGQVLPWQVAEYAQKLKRGSAPFKLLAWYLHKLVMIDVKLNGEFDRTGSTAEEPLWFKQYLGFFKSYMVLLSLCNIPDLLLVAACTPILFRIRSRVSKYDLEATLRKFDAEGLSREGILRLSNALKDLHTNVWSAIRPTGLSICFGVWAFCGSWTSILVLPLVFLLQLLDLDAGRFLSELGNKIAAIRPSPTSKEPYSPGDGFHPWWGVDYIHCVPFRHAEHVKPYPLHSASFVVYGSNGDHTPFRYGQKVLQAFGIPTTFVEAETREKGTRDLHLIENGIPAPALSGLRRLRRCTSEEYATSEVVFVPWYNQWRLPGVIHVALFDMLTNKAPTVGETWTDFLGAMFQTVAEPDVDMGSTGRALPFSPNGREPLTYLGKYGSGWPNRLLCRLYALLFGPCAPESLPPTRWGKAAATVIWSRLKRPDYWVTGLIKRLVATGSSTSVDWQAVPPGSYWNACCPPENVPADALLEPSRDHKNIFRHYDIVYSHGGAGSMRTAAAAGADPVSLSSLLDRRVRAPGLIEDVAMMRNNPFSYPAQIAYASPAMTPYVMGQIYMHKGLPHALAFAVTLVADFDWFRLVKACANYTRVVAAYIAVFAYVYSCCLSSSSSMGVIMEMLKWQTKLAFLFGPIVTLLLPSTLDWSYPWQLARLDLFAVDFHLHLATLAGTLLSMCGLQTTVPIEALYVAIHRKAPNGHDPKGVSLLASPVSGMYTHTAVKVGSEIFNTYVTTVNEPRTCNYQPAESKSGQSKEQPFEQCRYITPVRGDADESDMLKEYIVDMPIPCDPDEIDWGDIQYGVRARYGLEANCHTYTLRFLLFQDFEDVWPAFLFTAGQLAWASGPLALISALTVSNNSCVGTLVRLWETVRCGMENPEAAMILKRVRRGRALTTKDYRKLADILSVVYRKGNDWAVRTFNDRIDLLLFVYSVDRAGYSEYCTYFGVDKDISVHRKSKAGRKRNDSYDRLRRLKSESGSQPKKRDRPSKSSKLANAEADDERSVSRNRPPSKTLKTPKQIKKLAKQEANREKNKLRDAAIALGRRTKANQDEDDPLFAIGGENDELLDDNESAFAALPERIRKRVRTFQSDLLTSKLALQVLSDAGEVPVRVVNTDFVEVQRFGFANELSASTVRTYHGLRPDMVHNTVAWGTCLDKNPKAHTQRVSLYQGLRMFNCSVCRTQLGYKSRQADHHNHSLTTYGEVRATFQPCCFQLRRTNELSASKGQTEHTRLYELGKAIYRSSTKRIGSIQDAISIMRGYQLILGRPVRFYVKADSLLLEYTLPPLATFDYNLKAANVAIEADALLDDSATSWHFYGIADYGERADVTQLRPHDYADGKLIRLEASPVHKAAEGWVQVTLDWVCEQWPAHLSRQVNSKEQREEICAATKRVTDSLLTASEVISGLGLQLFVGILDGMDEFSGRIIAERNRSKPAIPPTTSPEFDKASFRGMSALDFHPDPIAPRIVPVGSKSRMTDAEEARGEGAYMHDDTRVIWGQRSYELEDILDEHLERVTRIFREARVPWTPNPAYRRVVNRNPYTDAHISWRKAWAIEQLHARPGVNSGLWATPTNKLASLSRYAYDPRPHSIDEATLDTYVKAIHTCYPNIYRGFQVLTDEQALRTIKQKMGPGNWFEGAQDITTGRMVVRKRAHLLKDPRVRREILKSIHSDAADRHLLPIVHTAFPKDYKDFQDKIEMNPLKMRTIVAPDLISLATDKKLFHTTDMVIKYLWRDTDCSIGLPFLGQAINAKLSRMPAAEQRLVIDLTAFDSTHPSFTSELLAKLYGPGFTSLGPAYQEVVSAQIQARWDRYYNGGIIRDIEDHIVVPHLRGSTTGSVSVTRVNVEVGRACLVMAIADLTGMSIPDVLARTQREIMGDDILIQFEDFQLDASKLVERLREITGISAKIEYQSRGLPNTKEASWHGAKYLSHYIYKADGYSKELSRAGLAPGSPAYPKYVITYDPSKAAMRATLDLRKKNLFKRWDTVVSMAQKSIHNRPLYDLAKAESLRLRARLTRVKGGKVYMDKRPLHPYHRQISNFYISSSALLAYRHRPESLTFHLKQAMDEAYRTLVRFSTQLRYTGIEFLGSPRLGSGAKGIFKTRAYIVEGYHYAMLQTRYGTVPYAAYTSACMLNPFSSTCHLQEAYEYYTSAGPQGLLLQWHHNRMQGLFLSFQGIRYFHAMAKSFRIFAFVDTIYSFTVGSPRLWWGIVSSLNILATGTPNPTLGALIPKDPYLMSKNLAAFLTACLPPRTYVVGVPQQGYVLCNNALVSILKAIYRQPSLTTFDESHGILVRPPVWDSYYDRHIYPTLINRRFVCVHAPTGSGKSAFLADLLARDFYRIFYVENRRLVAQNMRGFTYISRGVPVPDEKGKFTLTGGHLLMKINAHKVTPAPNDVFVMDEYDEADPYQMLLTYRLLAQNAYTLFLSATSNMKMLEFFRVHREAVLDVPVPPRYHVTEYQPVESGDIVEQIQVVLQKARGRVLVIEPSRTACERLLTTCQALDMDIDVMARGTGDPGSKVLLATQVAEKGVTIVGLEWVIDTGIMIRDHQGVLTTTRIDYRTYVQRRGRVGRTSQGHYVTLKKPVQLDVEPYPAFSTYLEEPAFFDGLHNIRSHIEVPSSGTHYQRITPYASLRLDCLHDVLREGSIPLVIGSLLLRYSRSPDFMLDFRRFLGGEVPTMYEDIFDLYSGTLLSLRDLPRQRLILAVESVIRNKPFEVRIDTHLTRFTFGFLESGIVKLDTDPAPPRNLVTTDPSAFIPGDLVPAKYGTPEGSVYRRSDLLVRQSKTSEVVGDLFSYLYCVSQHVNVLHTDKDVIQWARSVFPDFDISAPVSLKRARNLCSRAATLIGGTVILYHITARGPARAAFKCSKLATRLIRVVLASNRRLEMFHTGCAQIITRGSRMTQPLSIFDSEGRSRRKISMGETSEASSDTQEAIEVIPAHMKTALTALKETFSVLHGLRNPEGRDCGFNAALQFLYLSGIHAELRLAVPEQADRAQRLLMLEVRNMLNRYLRRSGAMDFRTMRRILSDVTGAPQDQYTDVSEILSTVLAANAWRQGTGPLHTIEEYNSMPSNSYEIVAMLGLADATARRVFVASNIILDRPLVGNEHDLDIIVDFVRMASPGLHLTRLPYNLCFQLTGGTMAQQMSDLPVKLNLVDPSSDQELTYDLYLTAHHEGGANGGHELIFVHTPDSDVIIRVSDVLIEESYIYEASTDGVRFALYRRRDALPDTSSTSPSLPDEDILAAVDTISVLWNWSFDFPWPSTTLDHTKCLRVDSTVDLSSLVSAKAEHSSSTCWKQLILSLGHYVSRNVNHTIRGVHALNPYVIAWDSVIDGAPSFNPMLLSRMKRLEILASFTYRTGILINLIMYHNLFNHSRLIKLPVVDCFKSSSDKTVWSLNVGLDLNHISLLQPGPFGHTSLVLEVFKIPPQLGILADKTVAATLVLRPTYLGDEGMAVIFPSQFLRNQDYIGLRKNTYRFNEIDFMCRTALQALTKVDLSGVLNRLTSVTERYNCNMRGPLHRATNCRICCCLYAYALATLSGIGLISYRGSEISSRFMNYGHPITRWFIIESDQFKIDDDVEIVELDLHIAKI